ncbi:MAG: nucleotidyltransferase domain-containing protein [Candidatus Binatia bacterium]
MTGEAPAQVLRRLADRYAALLVSTLGERLVSVVLFGSVGRGDASATSDLDLLIIARDLPAGQFARKRLLASADVAFERDLADAERSGMDTRLARIVRTPAEAARVIPLYLDMTEDAQLLYDRDAFFAGILDRVRTSLKRLGSRRIRKGKTWYWDLKPDFKRGDVIEM